MEDRFGRFAIGAGGLRRGQEHQVDVAERRHLPPSSATQSDQSDAMRFGSRGIVGQSDDLVVEEGGRASGRASPPWLLGQSASDLRAPRRQRLGEYFADLARLPFARANAGDP